MVDANCAYRAHEAIQIARKMEPYDIFWFEEPVAPVFVDGTLRTTLRGEGLVDEFIAIMDDYVARRYGAATSA